MRWMIYGANGYTGELIARNARGQGLKPILAGRREAKVAPLAEQEGLEYRVFSLDDPDTLADELADVDLVLHCAGPFSRTSRAMLEGCLKARTHYLDITGEVAVFEHVFAQAARVEQAGIIACPGVGFDVIPTDCVAARLKEALPDARELSLGFSTRSGLSPGTAKTYKSISSYIIAPLNGNLFYSICHILNGNPQKSCSNIFRSNANFIRKFLKFSMNNPYI